MSGTPIKKKSPLRVIREGDFDKSNLNCPCKFLFILKY